jgi:hypothetical protein
MRTFALCGACFWLGCAILAAPASAQQGFDQPSLLPVPSYGNVSRLPPTSNPVAYRTAFNAPNEGASAEPLPNPPERSAIPRGPMSYPDPPAYGSGVGPMSASPMSGDFQQAASGGWDGMGACGPACGPVCNNPWYGYGGALVMGRANNNSCIPLGYETSTGVNVLTTASSPQKWAGGYEVVLGKYFNCGCNAIEFRWMHLMPGRSQNDAYTPNVPANFASRLDYQGLNYDDGSGAGPRNATNWTLSSQYQCLVHEYNFYGAELDLLGGGLSCGNCGNCNSCGGYGFGGSRWGGNWLAGARWFHYDEYFRYNSELFGEGTNGEADELWYEIRTKNELVGFQIGGQLTYALSRSFTILGSSRFGAYNNHVTAWQAIHGGTGNYAVINSGAQAGNPYNVSVSRDALAFLGEIDLGARWQITNCIAARFGYRAMGLSGVAVTDDQISRNFNCVCDASCIKLSSVALHGLYAGGEICW